MKKVLSAVIMLAMMVMAFSGVAAAEENLVIYGPHPVDVMNNRIDVFQEWVAENHGIEDVDVTYINASTQEIYDRVRAESENPHADVFLSVGELSMRATEEGYTEAYQVETWDRIPEFARDAEGYWYAQEILPFVIIYNKHLVDNPPTTWQELLDSEWKDEIIVRDPTQSGTAGTIAVSFIAAYGEEMGFDYLNRLDYQAGGSYTDSSSRTVYMVARGERPMAIWNEYFSRFVIDEGYDDLEVVYPEDWMTTGLETINLIDGRPNERMGELYMEFAMSEEGARVSAEDFRRPVLEGLEDMPEWIAEGDDLPILNIDWQRLSDLRGEWLDRWDSQVRGRGAGYVEDNPEIPTYEVIDEFIVE